MLFEYCIGWISWSKSYLLLSLIFVLWVAWIIQENSNWNIRSRGFLFSFNFSIKHTIARNSEITRRLWMTQIYFGSMLNRISYVTLRKKEVLCNTGEVLICKNNKLKFRKWLELNCLAWNVLTGSTSTQECSSWDSISDTAVTF